MELEPVEQNRRARRPYQQRWNDDERAVLGRDSMLHVELGQHARVQNQGQELVDQTHHQLGEWQQNHGDNYQDPPPASGASSQRKSIDEHQERREPHSDRTEVKPLRPSQDCFEQAFAPGGTKAEGVLELFLAAVDQVVANVVSRFAQVTVERCQLDRFPRHFDLVGVGLPGDELDYPAISVAGAKVLARINARGILAEDRFDMTALLEERVPVEGRQETQTEHAIAHGDLVGGLAALLTLQDFIRFRPAGGELGLEMLEHGGRWALVAQQLHKSDDKRIGEIDKRGRRLTYNAVFGLIKKTLRIRQRALGPLFRARRSSHLQIIFSDKRLRFSRRTKRSIVGKAQSSPIVKGADS